MVDLEKLMVRFYSSKEPMLGTPADSKPNLGRDVLLVVLPVIASFESKRRSVREATRDTEEGRWRTLAG